MRPDFQPCSYGFRPGRRTQDAIAEVQHFTFRSYEWVVEGDTSTSAKCATESLWRECLRSLRACGLTGVRFCISDAHAGLKAAIGQVLGFPWRRVSR